ncbi:MULTISPECIES: ParA family protein [Halomonadaceae]|uniref:AAA family ATPase n=1 Tax=Vreelandella halophila TaxID=86177 RepID=A0A9X5B5K4_9GAMM|nr:MULTISPECIES: ParA family protein [Halomonas]MYL26578.1 AAA family ATPase [Halomonas utahensis]MYL73915.1 AAA family ATPase [Halomonas sp. 22501_18_FS]
MRAVAVLNQKGGVGKTTTSVHLAHGMARLGEWVLGIDMDPQGHMGTSLGADNRLPGLDRVLLNEERLVDHRQNVREHLDLICAGPGLRSFETLDEGGPERGWWLNEALYELETESASEAPEWVIMDCPPSSGLLAMNALLAADDLVIPVSCDFLSLQGLSTLMQTLSKVEERMQGASRKWLVLTRFQTRRRLSREVQETLVNHFPGQLLQTPIRENVSLAEAPGFGRTVFEYQATSNGAADYAALVEDLRLGRVR